MRLSPPEARRRFAGQPVARLATVAEDGAPRLVPVVFALVPYDEREAIVHAVDHKPKTTTALARLAAITAEPRVSLLVDGYDEDWSRLWWARADALAEVVTSGPIWRGAITALQERHAQYRDAPPTGAVVAAVVHRWSGWAARADGEPTPDRS